MRWVKPPPDYSNKPHLVSFEMPVIYACVLFKGPWVNVTFIRLPQADSASPVASLHDRARAIALGQACGANCAAGHEGGSQ